MNIGECLSKRALNHANKLPASPTMGVAIVNVSSVDMASWSFESIKLVMKTRLTSGVEAAKYALF